MKELSFVTFHNPIFFNGKNWGNKIEPYHKAFAGKIKAWHCGDSVMLKSGGKTGHAPITNVSFYEFFEVVETKPMDMKAKAAEIEKSVMPTTITERQKPGPKPKITAQVSGPTHHVFAEGPGKSRD